jgi:DNA-directed RNA polymerase specialized sigma24 family protein
VTTLRAAKYFQALREGDPIFARFERGTDLLVYFHGDGDLDDKDRLYAALVRIAQARGRRARLAHGLLWCGLWPGLDHVYRRHLQQFTKDSEELTEAISVAFTTLVGRMDLSRVHRVAATLVRSTHREIMDERRRTVREESRMVGGSGGGMADLDGASRESSGSQPTGLSFAGELAVLRSHLVALVGADAELVLAVLVLDYDQHEAATRLGLSHEASRKRFQRALVRIRGHMSISADVGTEGRSPQAG